jgi:hypothetical protein
MNYDSWKTGSGVDLRTELLADRCADIESYLDSKLAAAVAEVNRLSDCQWVIEPVLADADDEGTISLEVSVRLSGLSVSGNPGDLQELAQAFLKMSETMSQAARCDLTQQGLKLAPSAQSHGQQNAELG